MIARNYAPELLPVQAGGVPGRSGVGSGVGSAVSSGVCYLCLLGGDAPVHLRL